MLTVCSPAGNCACKRARTCFETSAQAVSSTEERRSATIAFVRTIDSQNASTDGVVSTHTASRVSTSWKPAAVISATHSTGSTSAGRYGGVLDGGGSLSSSAPIAVMTSGTAVSGAQLATTAGAPGLRTRWSS